MDLVSFRSVVTLLGLLSIVVTVATNIWRQGNIDLTGRWANMRGIYGRAIIVGVVLAAVLRANIIDILQNPESPAALFGWLNLPWGEYATITERLIGVVEEVAGILVTGVVLAFFSKFWNDLFDLLYELKRLVRGKANASKPEEGAQRPASVSSSGGRRYGRSDRGGGSDRGGDRGGRGRRGGGDRGGRGRSSSSSSSSSSSNSSTSGNSSSSGISGL